MQTRSQIGDCDIECDTDQGETKGNQDTDQPQQAPNTYKPSRGYSASPWRQFTALYSREMANIIRNPADVIGRWGCLPQDSWPA
jgi:hypothetical protein